MRTTKTVAAAVILVSVGVVLLGRAGVPNTSVEVPAASKQLLVPVLDHLAIVHNDPECQGVDYAGRCAKLFRIYEDHFYKLLETDGPAGDEAIAVLFSFYVGEHDAEELVCAAAKRGNRMLPLFSKYKACNPDIRIKYPKGMRLQKSTCRMLMDDASQMIREGSAKKDCDY